MSLPPLLPFHLAFPVDDLEAARDFYVNLLGCSEGRSSDSWVDFNFRGHQIVAHYSPENVVGAKSSKVDNRDVPCRHAGVILEFDDWHATANRLKGAGVKFIIEPYVRFEGEAGEQATMFLNDPAGNAIELKSFKNIGQLFAT